MKKWKRWTFEESIEVLNRRRSGETLAEIASGYGLSVERIRQVVNKAMRWERTRELQRAAEQGS